MNQLIPLIIAVILGGFATVLSLVLIGPQFSERSADIKAQQFATAGSSIEAAMRIYKTERAVSAFETDFATTMVDATNTDGLVDLGYLSQVPVAPQGVYELEVGTNNDVYLTARGADVSVAVCEAVEELDNGPTSGAFTATVDTGDLTVDMAASRLACFDTLATPGELYLAFKVE
tara:strand:- start:109 stop:633 length:525 start_codon:yes stop_codon:yes gene_type:complete